MVFVLRVKRNIKEAPTKPNQHTHQKPVLAITFWLAVGIKNNFCDQTKEKFFFAWHRTKEQSSQQTFNISINLFYLTKRVSVRDRVWSVSFLQVTLSLHWIALKIISFGGDNTIKFRCRNSNLINKTKSNIKKVSFMCNRLHNLNRWENNWHSICHSCFFILSSSKIYYCFYRMMNHFDESELSCIWLWIAVGKSMNAMPKWMVSLAVFIVKRFR